MDVRPDAAAGGSLRRTQHGGLRSWTRRALLFTGAAAAAGTVLRGDSGVARRGRAAPFPASLPLPLPTVPAVTPQQFGGVADGSTDCYGALSAAMAAAARLGLPVFLSRGQWYSVSSGWQGVAIPEGVEVYGEPGTVCTWGATQPWGYPMFSIQGDGVRLHDLVFSAPRVGQNAIGGATGFRGAHLYALDCRDGACLNGLFGCVEALIEDCTVDGARTCAVLTRPLLPGQACTRLDVAPLAAALQAGDVLYVYRYPGGGGLSRAAVLRGAVFERAVVADAVPAGAGEIPVEPFTPGRAMPAGSPVRQIAIATGIAMTGQYGNWSTVPPGPNGSWVYASLIRNCTVINCDAANVFINMGYRSGIEGCYGSVAHDLCFDLEYGYMSWIRDCEAHFGGNRGIASEMTGSQNDISNNRVYDTTGEDGIRVTTDYVPPQNPYPLGGHTVTGNLVQRAFWGIALQGTWGVVEGNTCQYNRAAGIHLENAPDPGTSGEATELRGNTCTFNYGVGLDLLNTGNARVASDNVFAYNGYLGPVPPPRGAPTPALAAGPSALAEDSYALAYAWQADVAVMGGTQRVTTSPSLPAIVAVPAGQASQVVWSVTLPDGVAGVAVAFESQASYARRVPWYNDPERTFAARALLLPPRRLGYVDAAGGVTYDGSATAGLAASVSGRTLTIRLTAEAAADGHVPDWDTCAGIWLNPGTGANTANTLGGNIHDNGYGGVYGWSSGTVLDGGTVATHTAVGAFTGTAALTARGVAVQGAHLGALGGVSSGGGGFTACTFDAIATDCIRYTAAINGAAHDEVITGCRFGTSLPCGTGIWNDATVGYPGNASDPRPGLVEDCTFGQVGVAVDDNGGTQTPLTMGGGNVGL